MLTPVSMAGMAEILSRTKMAPLHLEANSDKLHMEHLEFFGKQLEAHISHTRHLELSGNRLSTMVNQFVSPTPTLEFLSLSIHCVRMSYPTPLFPTISSIALPPASQPSSWTNATLVGSRLSSRVYES